MASTTRRVSECGARVASARRRGLRTLDAARLTDSIARLRYRNGRERGEPATPGAPVQVTITLYPTSNLFMPGHRIRLDVSSSNFPRTVFHGRGRESRVILPIIRIAP
jgi:predicted acyl esterase